MSSEISLSGQGACLQALPTRQTTPGFPTPSTLATRVWKASSQWWVRRREVLSQNTHWVAWGCCCWTHRHFPHRICLSSSQRLFPFPSFPCALPFSCDVSFSGSSWAHGPQCRWCGGLRKVDKPTVISSHDISTHKSHNNHRPDKPMSLALSFSIWLTQATKFLKHRIPFQILLGYGTIPPIGWHLVLSP